ncbi:MAG: DUF423 domain-containing protein [Rhodothermales bacterium]|nr:DUF423 domain-containing protein [Rhodothermales bacterium]
MIEGRILAVLGALLSALAVGLGAFGAHALKDVLDPQALETWTTGTTYLGWHAAALLLTGLLAEFVRPGLINTAGALFLAGIFLFCGSLFVLALGGPRWFGPVTPLGGVAFISGWIVTAVAVWRMMDAT